MKKAETSAISEEVKRIVCDEANRIAELLTQPNLDPITTVSKAEFERKFLPLLANVGEDFNIQAWIEETSHPFVRLHVVDDLGSVIFNIPPLFAQQKTCEVSGLRIGDQTDKIESLSSDNPRLAMSYVGRLLKKFSDTDFNSKDSADEMALSLNEVFKYYNMPLLKTYKSDADISAPAPAKATIIDYEDF